MAIAVKFEKARAEYYLRCLATGQPIKPPGEAWTGNDMLSLAGACFFGAMSQGPASFWLKDIPEGLHPERQEAVEEHFDHDLHAAIGFYGHLTMLVADGQFDDPYASNVIALVSQVGDLQQAIVPIKGMKEYPDRI